MTRLERRAHQILVEGLLDELAEGRQQYYRLQAFGVQAAGAKPVKEDLRRTQDRLRDYVDLHYV